MQGLPVALLRPGSGAVPGLALPSLAGASGEDMELAVLLRLSLAAQKEEEKAAKASEARTDGISPGGGVRGLQGFSPGQASTAFPSQNAVLSRLWSESSTFPVEVFMQFLVSLQDRVQQRFLLQYAFLSGLWSKSSIFLVEFLKVSLPDRVHSVLWSRTRYHSSSSRSGLGDGGLHGLSQEQGSTAVCGAEHVDIPVPHGRGKLGDGVFSASTTFCRLVLLVTMPLVFFLLVARLVLLVTNLVLCLLVARQVLLVKMPLVVLLLAARLVPASPRTLWISFSSSTASSSLILAASGSPKDMASPS